MFEIAWVAGNEVIGLTLGSGDCLNGILKIAPAERQCLLLHLKINGFDAEQSGEINQNSGGFLLPQVLGQQVMQGGQGMRCNMSGGPPCSMYASKRAESSNQGSRCASTSSTTLVSMKSFTDRACCEDGLGIRQHPSVAAAPRPDGLP